MAGRDRSNTMTMTNNPTAASPERSAEAQALGVPGTSGPRTQIGEVKDQVVDEAKNSFRQARESAASSLNQSRQQAAQRIGKIATAIRTTSDHLRSEDQPRVADLTESLAEQAERLSSYLRNRDLTGFRDDLQNFARRRPAVAMGAALAVGMLAARFFKSSPRTGGGAYGGA
jgi:hypothetical protein